MHFVRLLSDLLSACDERRFGEYENQSWWEFADAEHRSPGFQKFLADGLTRSLVAARAREMSARTGGYILLQLLQDLATPGGQADRVLNGPTSDVWIDPWLDELRRLGVDYRLGCRVEAIESRGARVTGVRIQPVDAAFAPVGAGVRRHSADHYVAAVPGRGAARGDRDGRAQAASPALAGLDRLQVRWMNGIMFYLTRDVPLVHGHTIYIDSAWALTSISQRQFWPRFNPHDMGDGDVGGILSVDISDWDTPGEYSAKGKIARECTREEIADEVWDQLKAALNNGTTVLDDASARRWFLDPSIVHPNPTRGDEPRAAARQHGRLVGRTGRRRRCPKSTTSSSPPTTCRPTPTWPRWRAPTKRRAAPSTRSSTPPAPTRSRAACGRCATRAACRSPSPARSTECSTGCPAGTARRRRSRSGTASSS